MNEDLKHKAINLLKELGYTNISGLSDILYLSIQFNLTASSSVAETPDGLHIGPSNS